MNQQLKTYIHTWITLTLVMCKILHTWGQPTNDFELSKLIDQHIISNMEFNPSTKAIPELDNMHSNHLDRTSDIISSSYWSHENNPMLPTTSTFPPLQDCWGSAAGELHGTRSVQGPPSADIYLNNLSHSSPPFVTLEDPLFTCLNPINVNSNSNNAMQTGLSDTEWVDHWVKSLETPKITDILHPEPEVELPSINSSTSHSREDSILNRESNFSLEPDNSYQLRATSPELPLQSPAYVVKLMPDWMNPQRVETQQSSVLQTTSMDSPVIYPWPSLMAEQFLYHDSTLGMNVGNPGSYLPEETERIDDPFFHIPCLESQSIDFNYPTQHVTADDHHDYSEFGWQVHHFIGGVKSQGDHLFPPTRPAEKTPPTQMVSDERGFGGSISSPNLNDAVARNGHNGTNMNKRKRRSSKNLKLQSSRSANNENTSISGIYNDCIYKFAEESKEYSNTVTNKRLLMKLMILIRRFGESNNLYCFTSKGHLPLPRIDQLIKDNPNKVVLGPKINKAQKVLSRPFINLLLILHPEVFTLHHSKDKLIEDGLKFLEEISTQWWSLEVKTDLKAWDPPPNSLFDLSEPFSLLQYASNLGRSSYLNLKTLWKVWKRWYRSSKYSNKTLVVGIRQFSQLITLNLVKLQSKYGPDEVDTLLESIHSKILNDLHLEEPKTQIPGETSLGEKYTWKELYNPAIRIGKYQYELLTLRVEADRYFDQLAEALHLKCFSEDQDSSRCTKIVNGIVRKIYYELTPCFFGSLLALKSKFQSNLSIQNLIDDGWDFLKVFLNALKTSYSTKESDLEGVDPMPAAHHILSFLYNKHIEQSFTLGSVSSLVMTWFHQSSLPDKQVVNESEDLSELLTDIYATNEFPMLPIR